MGYEIKLYIGEKRPGGPFIEIGQIDLSKIGEGPLGNLIGFAQGKGSSVEFKDFKFLRDIKGKHMGMDPMASDMFDIGMDYEFVEIWDGEEKVKEDLYGDQLPAIPLDHILAALKEELKGGHYRRFKLAEAFLQELTSSEWHNIYIVPFGH
jgi:hypothetical protein